MTYQRLLEFATIAQAWLSSNPKDNKFRYAVLKMQARCKPHVQTYYELVEDLRVQNALTDADKAIVRDDKGIARMTIPGNLAFNKAQRELAVTDVAVEPYFAEVPSDLPIIFHAALVGFVIADVEEFEPSHAG